MSYLDVKTNTCSERIPIMFKFFATTIIENGVQTKNKRGTLEQAMANKEEVLIIEPDYVKFYVNRRNMNMYDRFRNQAEYLMRSYPEIYKYIPIEVILHD